MRAASNSGIRVNGFQLALKGFRVNLDVASRILVLLLVVWFVWSVGKCHFQYRMLRIHSLGRTGSG